MNLPRVAIYALWLAKGYFTVNQMEIGIELAEKIAIFWKISIILDYWWFSQPIFQSRLRVEDWFNLSAFFTRGAPDKKKKGKFPRLAKAFLLRVAESNRNWNFYRVHFFVPSMHEVPFAATPPRELQWEPCLEKSDDANNRVQTYLSKVGVKITTRFVRTCGILTHRKALPTA